LFVRAQFGADLGYVPHEGVPITPTPSVGVEWHLSHFALGLDGHFDLPGTTSGQGPGSITVSALRAVVTGCFHTNWASRFTPSACALFSAGALQGTGSGVTTEHSAATLLLHAGARFALDLNVWGPVALRAQGDLAATLTHTDLYLAGARLWSTPAMVAGVHVGLVVQIL
jgi:hypothetical protein